MSESTKPTYCGFGIAPHIAATTDLTQFRRGYSVSGVDIFAVPVDADGMTLDEAVAAVLSPLYEEVCELVDLAEDHQPTYSSASYTYANCEGLGTDQYIWAFQVAWRDDYVMVAALQLTTAEGEHYDAIFDRVSRPFWLRE
jgi:hypothetical protein